MIYYPMSCGRNMAEILRVIDALQLADRFGVATPANWTPGSDVILPAPLTQEMADARVAEGLPGMKDWYFTKKPQPRE
jgi:peroxiredoxin (alkyl hydroperoxide reductase subunit C)